MIGAIAEGPNVRISARRIKVSKRGVTRTAGLSRRKRRLVRRLGRRVNVEAKAVEEGEFGPKTTSVTFVLRTPR